MGLNHTGTKLLLYAKKQGVNFSKTATIGRQGLHLHESILKKNLDEYGYKDVNCSELLKSNNGFAEPFLQLLGAKETDSVDASTYEAATLIHDMNLPLPDIHKNKYDAVIDGGSLEHIFNFPTAIKNCMEMLKPGGHFLSITPTNNFWGHGFYQFNPELFFRVLSPDNGFKVEKILVYVDQTDSNWYEVPDPKEIKRRLIMSNRYPSSLFVMAKKTANVPLFTNTPQQSDYQHISWKKEGDISLLKQNQRKITLAVKFSNFFKQLQSLKSDIGDADTDFIKKVN